MATIFSIMPVTPHTIPANSKLLRQLMSLEAKNPKDIKIIPKAKNSKDQDFLLIFAVK